VLRIGLVMLQGARHAHIAALVAAADVSEIDLEVIELRTPDDLQVTDPDGIVFPGGETTTMRLTGGPEGNGLLPALFEWLRANPGCPVLATCAGAILLADPQDGGEPLIDATVSRNAYGNQADSFQADLRITGLDEPKSASEFPGVFIRAPRYDAVGDDSTITATHDDEVVGIRCGNRMALAFHPELSDDRRFHRWLLETAQSVRT